MAELLLLLLACTGGEDRDSGADGTPEPGVELAACATGAPTSLEGTHYFRNWSTGGVTTADCTWEILGKAEPEACPTCAAAYHLAFTERGGETGDGCSQHLELVRTNYDQAVLGFYEADDGPLAGWVRASGEPFAFARVSTMQLQDDGCELTYEDPAELGYTNSDAEGGTVLLR